MDKKLPGVFANQINKKLDNAQEIYYGVLKKEELIRDDASITTKINRIFHSPKHVYKSKVEITTKEGIEQQTIIGQQGDYLISLDGKKISIKDILDITMK